MSSAAITVENLSKKYRICHEPTRERYIALRDVLAKQLKDLLRLGRSARPNDRRSFEDFWALRDLSFDVKQGEVVGIIGRNGAGKSTLLKILSQITEPTIGRIRLRGRLASLLEIGTGFHPELTGRENIFLNGAILGMPRAEIRRKFDEIVAFAEVEKFLDTPVKRYSSGMYVRLAFAVAAHLESDILIVDEVLAVGDAAFQEKCIGKMHTAARSDGRTVLFVSHNMPVIQHLCSRVLLMSSGRLVESGDPASIVRHYLSDTHKKPNVELSDWTDRTTTGEATITQLEVGDASEGNRITFGHDFRFRIHATFKASLSDPTFGLIIHDSAGLPLVNVQTLHQGLRLGNVTGNIVVDGMIPKLSLYPGRYLVSPWITDSAFQRDIDFVRMCTEVNIITAPGPNGDLKLDSDWGKYFLSSDWNLRQC